MSRRAAYRCAAMTLCIMVGICIDIPLSIMRAMPEAPFFVVMNSTIATHVIAVVCLILAAVCLALGELEDPG